MAADTMSIRKGGIILIGIAETALHFLLFADDRDHAGRRHEAARRAPVSGLREQGHFPPSGGSGGRGDVLAFRSPLCELTHVPHFLCVCFLWFGPQGAVPANAKLYYEVELLRWVPEEKADVVQRCLGLSARDGRFSWRHDIDFVGVAVPHFTVMLYCCHVPLCRCQKFTLGLACCSEASFPCIGKDKPGLDGAVTGAASIPS